MSRPAATLQKMDAAVAAVEAELGTAHVGGEEPAGALSSSGISSSSDSDDPDLMLGGGTQWRRTSFTAFVPGQPRRTSVFARDESTTISEEAA